MAKCEDILTHVTTYTATISKIIHVIPFAIVKVIFGVVVIEFFVYVVVFFLGLRAVPGSLFFRLGLIGCDV